MTTIKLYALSAVITAPLFMALDFTWLSLTTSRLYKPALFVHLAGNYDGKAAVLFYLLYIVGITFFAVQPGQGDDPVWVAARGFLLGLVAYGTYDLTNQATLSAWPWMLTFIDMAWGGFATGCAAWATRIILNKIIAD